MHGQIIPDWVPPAVRSMAGIIRPLGPHDIKWRLLTNRRMKSVWRTLRRAKVRQAAIDGLENWRRLPRDQRGFIARRGLCRILCQRRCRA